MPRINTSEINNLLHIVDYLETQNILPIKESGGMSVYFSPFREEKTPSFVVYVNTNTFCDFATMQTGSIITIVMKFEKVGFFQACKMIENQSLNVSISFKHSSVTTGKPKVESYVSSIGNIKSESLIKYLEKRCIPLSTASKYVGEIHYSINSNHYYGLGFRNNSGGYELRSESFKRCLNKKDITFIDSKLEDKSTVLVFEGFFNFLSYLAIYKQNRPIHDCIVANSTALIDRVSNFINEQKYSDVISYLDNDNSGEIALHKLYARIETAHIINVSKLYYPNHKDLNDFLCQTKK